MQRNRAINAIKASARWRMATDAALQGALNRASMSSNAEDQSAPLIPDHAGVSFVTTASMIAPTPMSLRSDFSFAGKTGLARDLTTVWQILTGSWINLLLICTPLGFASEYLGWGAVSTFFLNFLTLIPLALILGDITEDLALRFGPVIGGLINATFGNVVEIILSLAALMNGLYEVVAYSLLGSILSNLLLVLGCCMLFGGAYYKTQTFNEVGNRTCASLLFLAVIGIILPTAAQMMIHDVTPAQKTDMIDGVSHAAALVLLGIYVCYLVFQLKTHKDLFVEEGEEEEEPRLSVGMAFSLLLIITVIVAFSSEFLTASIEEVSVHTPLSKAFLGMIVLPIAGNACEHITAIIVAMKNKMDLALGVAVGSSIQVAMLALPLVVVVGWATGHAFTMAMDPFSVLALTVAVIHCNVITTDATSHWLLGLQLVAVYIILGITYFYR